MSAYQFKGAREPWRLDREEWERSARFFNALANNEWWGHFPPTELYKVYEGTRKHAEGMTKLMAAWGNRI